MKFKYFLRGLGVGIVFACIICLAAFQENASDKMTDAEVIERAKQLGMVEQENQIGDLLKDKNSSEEEGATQTKENSSTSEQAVSEEDTEEKSTEQKSTTQKNDSEKVSSTQADSSEQQADPKESATTEQADKGNSSTEETVEITVEKGSSSYPICQKLEALGMIKNAAEFDTYLIENGYANRIRVGTHKLTKGMDYKAIAEAISDPL